MSVFLGIDIGTSGTKALAIDDKGQVLASAIESYPCHYPKPLWSEQDPEDWWQATIKAVRAVIKQKSLKPQDVKAIGLSGQMHGAVFLDKQSCVIRKAILWNDQRTQAECAEIEECTGGRQELIKLVANPALTGFTAPKILWLRNHEPSNFSKTCKILLPKDEIRRRLTGEYATDMSDASGTLLLDVVNRSWCKPLLSRLGIDLELLAKCYESQEITGKLTAEAASLLGLHPSCIVVAGAGDQAAGAVGNGIVDTGVISTSLGTSGVLFSYSDMPEVDPSGRLHTFCHAVSGKWHMMGVNLCSAGCLQWFRNQFCQSEFAATKLAHSDFYDVLTQEASTAPAGSEGLFFLPYLSGERTPYADPDARGCFVGLTLAHKRGHLVRAIMEGVAYALRDSLEIIRDLGVPVKQIRVSGGGSRSELWRQIQADMFGQEVVMVSVSAEEGPAYGAALLAAVGAGAFKNIQEACNTTIKVGQRTPAGHIALNHYNRAYPIYQGLYQSLKHDFKKIAALAIPNESETLACSRL